MGKSKYGISLPAIAVLCLIFAILRQPLLVVLICGYSVLAEKNEWLNKHVLYTLIIMICYYLIQLFLGGFFDLLSNFVDLVVDDFSNAPHTILKVGSIIDQVIYVLFVIFYAIRAIFAATGKNVNSGFINKIVSKISE